MQPGNVSNKPPASVASPALTNAIHDNFVLVTLDSPAAFHLKNAAPCVMTIAKLTKPQSIGKGLIDPRNHRGMSSLTVR